MATSKGGYDYQFLDTPSDVLLCKVCHFPSREPHLSVCCGHTFCKSCLDGMKQASYHLGFQTSFAASLHSATPPLQCPMCRSEDFSTVANKQNERVINSLRVLCTNEDKGCDWQGEVNDITGHLRSSDGCLFEEVKCSNDCGLLLQRQHVPDHIANECPCREVHCQYCSVVGEYQFIEGEHIKQCPKFPLSCPNNCEMEIMIFREDMEAHKTTCPLEEIECPNDCGTASQRQSMSSHVEIECPRRKIDCQYCQLVGEYHDLIEGQHKEECPKLPICCPNECDAGSIPREDMEDHRQKCPLEVVECEYCSVGCLDTVVRKDQHIHEKEKMKEHLVLTKSELSLTKSELGDMKTKHDSKINDLETELQQNHTKIKKLELELQQNHAKISVLESKAENSYEKLQKVEFELQQNNAVMKLLFGERSMQLYTRAAQLSSGDQVLPVIVRMSEYTQKKEDDVQWYSDPFYTHKEGYKIWLKVVPNGCDTGKDTHLSVCLYLLSGPSDHLLPWPLIGKFRVTLLNQLSDANHTVGQTISIDRVTWSLWNNTKMIWFRPSFIKTTKLLSSQYLKNDSLFFEVSKG